MRMAIFVTFFLWLAGLLGCQDPGKGRVEGTFTIPDCDLDESEINLRVDHFTAQYFENTLTVRLQHSTQNYVFANGLQLEVRNLDAVADRLGEPLEITLVPSLQDYKESGPTIESGYETGYPATPYHSPARAALYLNEICPEALVSFTDGEGTVTFTHIYRPGGSSRIAGSFVLEFLDPRTWKSPEEYGSRAQISGTFDFDY